MVSGDPRRRNPRKRPVKIQVTPLDLDAFEEGKLKERDEHLYRFIRGGEEFTLPPFGSLDRELMDTADDDVEFMMEAFKQGLVMISGEEAWDKFREMPLTLDGMNKLFGDWGDHSGMDTGK